jgi:SAM-dependent methyltransferase
MCGARIRSRLLGTAGTLNASNRDAWVTQQLALVPAGAALLDAGAGEAPYAALCGHLHYTSQDFAQYDGTGTHGLHTGAWDSRRLDIVSDITEIPVDDASFDAVLCTEVLEHVPDPTAALRELVRVLRPSGVLLVTAPLSSLTHFAPYHFATGLNRYYYEHVLPLLHVDIEAIDVNGNYYEALAQELRRLSWVARNHSRSRTRGIDNVAAAWLIRVLSRLSAHDRGSADLTAHGLHVRARKR